MADAFCSEEEAEQVEASGDAKLLRARTRKYQGYLYVITCNIDASPTGKVEFTIPEEYKIDGDAEVMFENRKVRVKEGKFTDEFPAHFRHVYKMKIR